MKKLNLLMMLFALLLTACSDDPNSDGRTNNSGIVGLNIKDAKLIYGVEQSSLKSLSRSSNPYAPQYFRQITTLNENMPVNWVKENGDTTSIIPISAIAKLTNDYLLITTHMFIDDDSGLGLVSQEAGGYIVNKSTGKIINPENRFSVTRSGYDNFASYYDGDRYCYITTSNSANYDKNITRIDFKTFEIQTLLEGCDDVKMLSNGSFFAHMIDGKHKYGSLMHGDMHEFADIEDFKGYDSYFPVRSSDDAIRILAIKNNHTENEWGERLNKQIDIINFSAAPNGYSGYFDHRLGDERFSVNVRLDFLDSYSPNDPMGVYVVVNSVKISETDEIIYLRLLYGMLNGDKEELLLKYQNAIVGEMGLYKLSDDLLPGFASNNDYDINPYPIIAKNSKASFNLLSEKGIIITKFEDLSQHIIENYGIFSFNGIIGNYENDKPVTFIGDNWEEKKQCIGTIDAEGNVEILEIFSIDNNEAMNGFLLELQ